MVEYLIENPDISMGIGVLFMLTGGLLALCFISNGLIFPFIISILLTFPASYYFLYPNEMMNENQKEAITNSGVNIRKDAKSTLAIDVHPPITNSHIR